MRNVFTLAVFVLAVPLAEASGIREFNVPVLEKLGRELSRRDSIAARAADLVVETQPLSKSLKMRGWITELGRNEDTVYLIAETASGPTLAYTVQFRHSGKPAVQDVRGQPLPDGVAVRYRARQTAITALAGRLFKTSYNFEILDDPDGRGFLVYALAATTDSDQVVMAGHFRVTVSADGKKAEQVDALSKSLVLSGPMKSGVPQGGEAVALFLIQLVSDKPVETLIYTANLARKDIYVRTPDGKTWVVGKGKMRVNPSKASGSTSAGTALKATGR